jgi:hypothetical protein
LLVSRGGAVWDNLLGDPVAIEVHSLLVVDQDHGNSLARGIAGEGVDHAFDVWQFYHDPFFLARD